MKILVTFAIEHEFTSWRRRENFVPVAAGSFPAFEARYNQSIVRVILTGIGSENAQRAVRAALPWQPNICICAGFAGGLRPGLEIGDVLAAESARDARTQRTVFADAKLLSVAEANGARRVETLCAADAVIATADDKRRMGQIADAVDMESFAVLNEAHEQGIAGIAIRAISDVADQDLPLDLTQVLDARGRVHVGKLLGRVLRAPHRIAALIRLGRASQKSAAALAAFLDTYVNELGAVKPLILERQASVATA